MKIYLFAYGQLKAPYYPVASLSSVDDDLIYGDLFDLNEDAAAINIGKSVNLIIGETQEISEADLKKLDKSESPQYKRIKIKTIKLKDVWVYEYVSPVPNTAKLINEWTPKHKSMFKKD